ncbi:helix-turn-helix domain-containing protein [Nocardia terpenica]|uniref:Insertion element IS150 protein InsJ-like helix-turn-helix domain-containing protein n=1 Tax=Nocardia terpenica TaxID=455432 RepID=A0A164JIL9_9NOCA|nr:helix-turn-helix domain-containing protein [Nocardia terpenica]KZM70440.1 hypothetical protein AWN90_03940 [Nocardia terpenica]NQE91123.1 helix-turn-helix domain containing protein [Nocardia terpenica]
MAQQGSPTDPKVTELAATRCLNPHPEAVTDAGFAGSEFFDARDVVQVKYEMVRRVRVDGIPVAEAGAAFGYSRQTVYQAAAALDASGLEGLVPGKPGPRGGHKLTAQVCAFAEAQLAEHPEWRAKDLVAPIQTRFGVRVHPRSIERALTRYRDGHSKSG